MARILLIDDDAGVRNIAGRILRAAGHTVAEAVDGREGLKALDGGSFDLVVTDIVMPIQEGIETIGEIRARSTIPILAVSGSAVTEASNVLLDAKLLGANAALGKPFTRSQLLDAVDRLLPHGESGRD